MAQTVGAIHHRFGIGDGFVLVVDEWESAEQFEAFFSNPDLQAFIGEIGADSDCRRRTSPSPRPSRPPTSSDRPGSRP